MPSQGFLSTVGATALAERARQVLAQNDLGSWTRPSPALYPHQWNWDSAFIAIGLVHDNPGRAQREILSLLRGQWRDGMIPHIVYNPLASGYFPDPERWQISRSQNAPEGVVTSGLTQPPMITIAVRALAQEPNALDFVRSVFPRLLKYHRWFHRERDPQGDGLVAIIHPWESGLDNSPRWVEILDRMVLTVRPAYRRRDDLLVSPSERPSDYDYDRYVYLLDLARDLRYDQSEILDRSPFVVQDVLVNSVLYHADVCLSEMANQLGEPTEEIEGWMTAARARFEQRLWDSQSGLYHDYDLGSNRPIRENTISTFMPLYAGLANQDQARELAERHLLNPDEYAADSLTRFRVPTTSKQSKHFDPRSYWRGPIWVNTNWFIIRGLERYGLREQADRLREETLRLIEQSGFFEYFDPRTGAGCGSNAFSWSAALTLDLLASGRSLNRT